jgi:hypothetical protein
MEFFLPIWNFSLPLGFGDSGKRLLFVEGRL